MSKNPVMYTRVALTFLCLLCLSPLGLTLSGCEVTEDPAAPDGINDGTSWLAVGSGVKGMESEWLLLTPEGEEIRGIGGSLISDPVEGEYWLLWEPVSEFNSPVSNPALIVYSRGEREIFESDYRPLTDGMGMLLIEPGIVIFEGSAFTAFAHMGPEPPRQMRSAIQIDIDEDFTIRHDSSFAATFTACLK